jgi:hypothetical protein
MSKADATANTRPIRIEDFIVDCDKKTNQKSNCNLNSYDIPKNQKEFGHRKRIKP